MSVFAVYVKVIEIDLRGVGFGRSLEGEHTAPAANHHCQWGGSLTKAQ